LGQPPLWRGEERPSWRVRSVWRGDLEFPRIRQPGRLERNRCMPMEETENLGGDRGGRPSVPSIRHVTGKEQAPQGTARQRGSKLPGGSHRRRSTDNDRESARVRPSSPGSADLAVGAGEQGRGPRTTTRGEPAVDAPAALPSTAPRAVRLGFAVSFEETGPCQNGASAPDTAGVKMPRPR